MARSRHEGRYWDKVDECETLKEEVGQALEAQMLCEQETDDLRTEVMRLQDLLLEVSVNGDSQVLQRQAAEIESQKKEIRDLKEENACV